MDNTFVTSVRSPELVTTVMRKDGVWNTVEVFQGEHQPDNTVAGLARNYEFDSRGFLVTEQHPETGTTRFGRDEVGNLTGELLQIDSSTYDLAYTINGLDQTDTLTYPSGRQVDFDRNALGWQTRAGTYVTQVDHYPTGAVSSMTYANGVVTNMDLDNRLRPASLTTSNGQTDYVNLQLAYDNAGNLNLITDNVGSLHDRTIGYDNFGRMTSATGPWGTESVTYDAFSNITSRDRNGVSQDYYYIDQKLAYRAFPTFYYVVTHDAHGNMRGDGENLMVYDGAGRLVSAENGLDLIDYRYDGADTRVSRSEPLTTEHILYNQAGRLLGEYNPVGGFTEYVYVNDETVAKIEDANAVVGQ